MRMIGGMSLHDCLMAGVAAVAVAAATPAQAQTRTFDIPAQAASTGIPQFAKQAGVQIIASGNAVAGRESNAVRGTYTVEEGLRILLKGTGLAPGKADGTGIIAIRSAEGNVPSGPQQITSSAVAAAQLAPDNETTEIVVTAEKKTEVSREVPMSVTALRGATLVAAHNLRFEDYAATVPGLILLQDHSYGSELVLRGVSSGVSSVNATVATYIDETPMLLVHQTGGSLYGTPDLDPFDMNRIEVLRGPQGTLYGATALGGLLKYVTNEPSTSAYSAAAEAGISTVSHGGVGYDIHGMTNVPISDNAAFRIVGYTNRYPGFIDDPSRAKTNINGSSYDGVRASLLYAPAPNLSVKLNALYQDRKWADTSDEDVAPVTYAPIYGKFAQENRTARPGHSRNQLYNATIHWGLGQVEVISSTSYFRSDNKIIADASKSLAPFLNAFIGPGYGAAVVETNPVRTFTQELRFSSFGVGRVQWQAGTFFANQNARVDEPFYPIGPGSSTILTNFPKNIGRFQLAERYTEIAAFSTFDYYLTPALDLSFGGRYSHNYQEYSDLGTGTLGRAANFKISTDQGVFTESADVRYHLARNNILYARVAKGFTPGGPNISNPANTGITSYDSSTTTNYEVGIKADTKDRIFSYEITGFYVDWNRIQLNGVVNAFGVVVNGTSARSKGVEWSFTCRPVSALSLGLNGAYTDAYLTGPTPSTVGGKIGDPLPEVPHWQVSGNAKFQRAIAPRTVASIGVSWRYLGPRFSDFISVGPRPRVRAVNLVDLHAGIAHGIWELSAYVKNAGNVRAVSSYQPETVAGGNGMLAAEIYTPRTIGFSVGARF